MLTVLLLRLDFPQHVCGKSVRITVSGFLLLWKNQEILWFWHRYRRHRRNNCPADRYILPEELLFYQSMNEELTVFVIQAKVFYKPGPAD